MKMNKWAKILAAVLLVVMALSLSACGGEKSADLTPYDVGDFTIGVPKNWVAVPTTFDNVSEPGMITVAKGTENATEAIGKPTVVICYYKEGKKIDLEATKESLEASGDIDEKLIKDLAGFEWTGFRCPSVVYDYEMLLGRVPGEENICLEVTIQASDGFGEKALSIEDKDVRAIVDSIVPNA